MSVVSAGIGMYYSFMCNTKMAIFFLMFSGLCDMVDGPIARTRKKRSEQEKKFGIQIDSLCDCVSFGVQPAVFYYFFTRVNAPEAEWLIKAAIAVGIMLMLCAVIRLAYFNVSEEERQRKAGDKLRDSYRGLPVTNVTIIVPLVFLTGFFLKGLAFAIVMLASELITAVLFVTDFNFPKIHGKKIILVGLFALLIFIGVIFV